MSALQQLAKMFRVSPDDVDAAMRSERGYRAALSRRQLFAAGAALAAGSVLSGGPLPIMCIENAEEHWLVHSWADYRDHLLGQGIDDDAPWFSLSEIIADSSEVPMREKRRILWDPEGQCITDSGDYTRSLSLSEWAHLYPDPGLLCTTEY